MKKLLLATAAAAILAAPTFAQNQGPTSTDPDPRVNQDLKRDPQQSGGGAVQAGQGGQANPGTSGQGMSKKAPGTTQGQGGVNTQGGRDDDRDGGIAPSPGHPK
jgi:hypothetical protein